MILGMAAVGALPLSSAVFAGEPTDGWVFGEFINRGDLKGWVRVFEAVRTRLRTRRRRLEVGVEDMNAFLTIIGSEGLIQHLLLC